MFRSLLHKENIKVNMVCRDRDSVLCELIDILPEWGINRAQKRDVLRKLISSEQFGTTAVGNGVALPHTTSSKILFPITALGISTEGVIYPSMDGEMVHLIFMILLPEYEDAHQEKQRILHDIQTFCADTFLRERLKNATSSEEAYNLLMHDHALMMSMLQKIGA